MIRIMKKLKNIVLVVVLSLTLTRLYAVDYAGPDKFICSGASAQIGIERIPRACYSWTSDPPGFTSDSACTIVTPTVTTKYILNVVGLNFSFTAIDTITVTIVSAITGTEVIPVRCCWKVGEPILREQFDIITEPVGLDSQIQSVEITPDYVTGVFLQARQEMSVTVSVTLECDNIQTIFTRTVQIIVVNEDVGLSVSAELWGCKGNEPCNFSKVTDLLKDISKIFKKVVPVINIESTLAISGSTKISDLCCVEDGGCIIQSYEVAGNVNAAVTIQGFFPIPPISPVYGTLIGSIGGDLTLSFTTECTQNKLCFAYTPSASIGGGVAIGNAEILGASLIVNVEVGFPIISFCVPSGEPEITGAFCASLKVVGEVTFISFIKESVNYTLLENLCYSVK